MHVLVQMEAGYGQQCMHAWFVLTGYGGAWTLTFGPLQPWGAQLQLYRFPCMTGCFSLGVHRMHHLCMCDAPVWVHHGQFSWSVRTRLDVECSWWAMVKSCDAHAYVQLFIFMHASCLEGSKSCIHAHARMATWDRWVESIQQSLHACCIVFMHMDLWWHSIVGGTWLLALHIAVSFVPWGSQLQSIFLMIDEHLYLCNFVLLAFMMWTAWRSPQIFKNHGGAPEKM